MRNKLIQQAQVNHTAKVQEDRMTSNIEQRPENEGKEFLLCDSWVTDVQLGCAYHKQSFYVGTYYVHSVVLSWIYQQFLQIMYFHH